MKCRNKFSMLKIHFAIIIKWKASNKHSLLMTYYWFRARSSVLPKDVSLKTSLTKNISMNLPLLSAAMDTVTESSMAIKLAQLGGLGVIHRNLSPKRQALEVRKVKKHESGIVTDPITADCELCRLCKFSNLMKKHKISGVPVMDNGHLTGIVTNRDLRFQERSDQSITTVMTPKERLITVKKGEEKKNILDLLHAKSYRKNFW